MRPIHAAAAAVLVIPLLALGSSQTASAGRRVSAPPSDPGVIEQWNQIGVTTMAADSATTPPRKAAVEGYLYLAFMHLAVYNAVVGIHGGYEGYRFDGTAPRGASSQAAAAAAAHRVLVTYSPQQQGALDAAYAASLDQVPDGLAKTRGVAFGELAAADVIAQRAGDGRNGPTQFTKAPAPGVWRPTPPANAAFQIPWLAEVRPLTVKSGEQFGDPGPPPPLTSRTYARDFEEVKSYGSATSTTRTAAQTATADFFSGNPLVQFTTALKDQADRRDLDIVESARMYAAVHTSLADAAISVWWSKLHYGIWRPITAIRLADTDGNDRTTADPGWTSKIASPPYPDYVSGYNGVMGAFSQALEEVFEDDDIDLRLTSTAVPGVTRHYDEGDDVRQEVIDARVWLGIHFRFADTAAARMGQQVAEYGLDHYFEPDSDDCD